jgi:hypothetical protein
VRLKGVLFLLLFVTACSKSPGARHLSYEVRAGKPVLEVFCIPGDRIRIVHPTPSDERRCDGKEVRGAEVFPLSPGDFTLGKNHWEASIATPKGGTVSVPYEFDYTPKPEELARLFALAEPPGGADNVTTPPEVSAPFLPGAPHTEAGISNGEVAFTLKAPLQTVLQAGDKSFTVESSKGVEVRLPLMDLLLDRNTREACAPFEVPVSVKRTDGVTHEGKLSIAKAVPRLLRGLEDEKPVLPAGPAKAHTALMLRDDGDCNALGNTKVRSVAVVVLIDQLRHDLEPCVDIPRIAFDVAMGAFEPRTGARKGEKTFVAKPPPCDRKHPPKETAFSSVEQKVIQQWVAKLLK